MGTLKHVIPKGGREWLTDLTRERLPRTIQKHIPNGVTVLGFLSMLGANRRYGRPEGLALMAASRAADDIDGDISRALDASSELGKMLDKVIDKADVAAILPAMWQANQGNAVRRGIIATVAAKQGLIATINGVALAKGNVKDSSRAGEINMYIDSLTLISLAAGDTFKEGGVRKAADFMAYGSFAIGAATGAAAIASYIPGLRAKNPDEEPQERNLPA